jgi:transcriptional regulator with XRE-family HTH domain
VEEGVRTRIAINLQRIRAEKALSLSEVARGAGISKATLSKLEAGMGNPTVETLAALAAFLGVKLEALLSDEAMRVRVVRPSEESWVRGSAVGMRKVDRMAGRSVVDVYEAEFKAGLRRESEGHGRGAIEHLFVVGGRLLAGPEGEEAELEAGDFARFAADRPHAYEAVGGDARAVLMISYTRMPSREQEMHRELEHLLSPADRPPTAEQEGPQAQRPSRSPRNSPPSPP